MKVDTWIYDFSFPTHDSGFTTFLGVSRRHLAGKGVVIPILTTIGLVVLETVISALKIFAGARKLFTSGERL